MNKKPEKDGIQRILTAAIDEFCRAGLAGAKLDVIALEAGVSKQLIHHYFRTKSALYVAVINHLTAKLIDGLSALDYESHTPEDALTLFLNHCYDIFIEWPFLAGLYNDQGLYGGEHTAECRELINRSPELIKRLETVLQRGQKSGVFRSELNVNEIIAATLMVVIGGFTHGPLLSSFTLMDFTTEESVEHWRNFSINFALNAIRL